MAKDNRLPKFNELLNPLLQALRDLGGSGTIEEISSRVSELLDLPEDILNLPRDPNKGSQTELAYRLAWARTYLKKYVIVDNSERGVWLIVPEKRGISYVDPQQVVKTVREMSRKEREARPSPEHLEEKIPEAEESWRPNSTIF